MLNIQSLSVTLGKKEIISGLSMDAASGQWWMVCGPNGAGKSTLLRSVSGAVPYQGKIVWNGKDRRFIKPRDWAKEVGLLSQHHPADYAFTVEETVRMGRYAYTGGLLRNHDPEGQEKVEAALHSVGLWEMRERSLLTLSGGELQRVFLAQVFAQDPKLLMLDEPANHLDLPYQKQLFSLIGEWMRKENRMVITVVHDLNLVSAFGTHALLMRDGRVIARGMKESVLTAENLNAAYGMDVQAWMRTLARNWL